MSRRDPGAANGAVAREPGRCRCGWLEPFHTVLPGGGRGGFPTAGCKRYAPKPASCLCAPNARCCCREEPDRG